MQPDPDAAAGDESCVRRVARRERRLDDRREALDALASARLLQVPPVARGQPRRDALEDRRLEVDGLARLDEHAPHLVAVRQPTRDFSAAAGDVADALASQPLDAERLDEELDEYSRAVLVARAEAGRARRQARRRASSRLASAAPRFQCRLF